MALWVGSRDPCLSQESWWIWLTHFLALGPGVTPGGFERLCLSWLSVISERDHSWDVEGETPTDVQIFTKILTCGWSGGHSQLTYGRACVVSGAAAD